MVVDFVGMCGAGTPFLPSELPSSHIHITLCLYVEVTLFVHAGLGHPAVPHPSTLPIVSHGGQRNTTSGGWGCFLGVGIRPFIMCKPCPG